SGAPPRTLTRPPWTRTPSPRTSRRLATTTHQRAGSNRSRPPPQRTVRSTAATRASTGFRPAAVRPSSIPRPSPSQIFPPSGRPSSCPTFRFLFRRRPQHRRIPPLVSAAI
ncbi:MAG: hypothetical protein ACK55Z_11245, partial [bacterium]